MTASSYAIYGLICCGLACLLVGWGLTSQRSSYEDGSFIYEIMFWLAGAALLMSALLWTLIKSI